MNGRTWLPAKSDTAEKRPSCGANSSGRLPFTSITLARQHYSHEWSPNACLRLRDGIERIAKANSLDGIETAMAIAYAIGVLISLTKEVIPPEISATLALEIMVGVSHMVPMKEPI